MTMVHIKGGVIQIERTAFIACVNLQSIGMPRVVMALVNKAFEGCKQFKGFSRGTIHDNDDVIIRNGNE